MKWTLPKGKIKACPRCKSSKVLSYSDMNELFLVILRWHLTVFPQSAAWNHPTYRPETDTSIIISGINGFPKYDVLWTSSWKMYSSLISQMWSDFFIVAFTATPQIVSLKGLNQFSCIGLYMKQQYFSRSAPCKIPTFVKTLLDLTDTENS